MDTKFAVVHVQIKNFQEPPEAMRTVGDCIFVVWNHPAGGSFWS